MTKEEMAKNAYSKIILEIKDKKITQKYIARKMGLAPQTFSDNINKLAVGDFPKVDFLISLQEVLGINLGINF